MKKIILIATIILFSVNAIFSQNINSYQYDNLNRLKQVSYPNGTVLNYTYDQLGNRTGKTISSCNLPVAPGGITGATTVCQGQASLTYSIVAISNATSYTWSLPGGWSGSSSGTSITCIPGGSGGTIAVATNNSCGSGPQKTLSVTVTALPLQPGTISGSTVVTSGNTYTYSIPAVNGATSYSWSYSGSGLPNGTGTSITLTPTSSGTLSVLAKNTCGSSSSSALNIAILGSNGYSILTSASPVAGGTTSAGGTYAAGQLYTATANANTGYTFVNWTENGTPVSTNASFAFTVSVNRTLVAYFTQNPVNYTISASANPLAGGSVSGGGSLASGQLCSLNAIANNGYSFTNWTENGTPVSTNPNYSFSVSGNRTLVANFALGSQTVDLNNGLMGYYPFNGNADDMSGMNNNGIVNGATLTTDRFCNENSAYNFAGISNPQTIKVLNSTSLQFTYAATFSFWINMNSYQGMDGYGSNNVNGYHMIFAKDYDQCCLTGGIGGMTNGEFTANGGTGSGGISLGDTVPNSSINQWVNITYVITTSNESIYADGNLVSSKNGTMSFASSNTKDLWFGRLYVKWYPFNGKMDDIRIYNRALNTSEIQAIHNLSSGIPKNGLVADYSFSGDANDNSGNNLNGTVNGNVTLTTDRNNKPNSAYHFGGTINDWIAVPHNELLNVGPDFSVSAWVYKESGSNNYVLGKGRDIECGSWSLGTPGISVNGSCGIGASNPTALNESQWYMITGVLNSITGKLRYYQDGQLITEVSSNPFSGNNIYPFAIGRHLTDNPASYSDSWPYPFKGKIDDILIYNRVLSDAEILQIYQSTSSNSGIPLAAGTITGTAAVCQGQNSVVYTLPAISNAASYAWTLPGGTTGTSNTNSIAVDYGVTAVSGVITARVTNNCGNSATSTLEIKVNSLPPSPFVTLSGNTLHSDAPLGNQWYNQKGILFGATQQNYTVLAEGNYYTVVTLFGCNSPGSNILNVVFTGTEITGYNKTIKIYPNPVSAELTIEIEGNSQLLNFEILNAIGQPVYKGNLIKKTTVQTADFSPGFYLIKIEKGNSFEYKKIIKE